MSLAETLISMALTLILSGAILSLVSAAQTIARTQPESADLQQRARIAMRTIGDDLRDAGAGITRGALAGPQVRHFPPIAPSADGGVTIWQTTSRDAQAYPSIMVATGSTTIPLGGDGTCPAGEAGCAFAAATSAMAWTSAGCRTALRIASANGDGLQLAAPLGGCALDPASAIAEGRVRTYRLDAAAHQLVRRDETTGSSAPLLDGVTAFSIAYYADAAASIPIGGVSDAELMRVRLVRVTLRFTAANPLLHVPDLAVSMDVAPRNAEER